MPEIKIKIEKQKMKNFAYITKIEPSQLADM